MGVVLSALTGRKKRRPFSISKRALAAAYEAAGRRRPFRPYFFTTGGSLTWTLKTQAVSSATLKKSVFPCTVQALKPCRWRESSCLSFGTVHPLCRITGKGSVFYRREDADTPQAEDALYRVEDIAAKTLEYMTAMEAAPQLKASGLDGDYRILADFGGTVLAGSPSKYGVQFVTWDWDYDRTGVVHGHYFMENYDGAKQDFATRSGLIQKEQVFSPEQLTEIFRCCADSVDEDFFELTDTQEEMIRGIQQQIRVCVPDLNERIRQQEEALERASQEQTM